LFNFKTIFPKAAPKTWSRKNDLLQGKGVTFPNLINSSSIKHDFKKSLAFMWKIDSFLKLRFLLITYLIEQNSAKWVKKLYWIDNDAPNPNKLKIWIAGLDSFLNPLRESKINAPKPKKKQDVFKELSN